MKQKEGRKMRKKSNDLKGKKERAECINYTNRKRDRETI